MRLHFENNIFVVSRSPRARPFAFNHLETLVLRGSYKESYMGQKGNLRALARVFLEVVQGHPTTECFQFRQKCLTWFSLRCLKPFWLIWSCPQNYFSVRMSWNFGRHESFRWLFRL